MTDGKSNKESRKSLTTPAINGMKPRCRDLSDIGENSGLRISCGATGSKAFYYRYRNPFNSSKTISMTFGHYPDMGLAEARKEFQALKAIRKAGRCPKAERDEQLRQSQEEDRLKSQQLEVERFTVKDLIDLYLKNKIEDRYDGDRKIPGCRKPKGQAEVRRTLYSDPVKELGDIPAAIVTRKDVTRMIEKMLSRGVNVQAGCVLRELTAAYEFAIGFGHLDDDFANPALLAKSSISKTGVRLTSKKGTRYLNDDELVLFLKWLPCSGYSTVQKNVMRFALWTGCRTGEVCGASWRDINLENGTWFLKDEETKSGIARTVQLSRQAVEFLTQLKLMTGEYPFPSSRTKLPIQQKSLSETKWHLKNPAKLSNGRKYTEEQSLLSSIPDWSPHDLRRTVRTGLARLGCPGDVAETVLGHTLEGLKSTYDLHRYDDECKKWLQIWAGHLDNLKAQALADNVIAASFKSA